MTAEFQVSVSALREAMDDLQALSPERRRTGRRNPLWSRPDLRGAVPGQMVHERVAARFFRDLAAGRRKRLRRSLAGSSWHPDELERLLRRTLHEGYLNALLRRVQGRLTARQLLGLGQATDRFARCLAEIFSRFSAPATPDEISRWVLSPEQLYSARRDLGGGRSLNITGRPDGSLRDPSTGRVLVLELKCRSDEQADKDLLQVALYAWLLEQGQGVKAEGRVLYLEEGGGVVSYSRDELSCVSSSPSADAFLSLVWSTMAGRVAAEDCWEGFLNSERPPPDSVELSRAPGRNGRGRPARQAGAESTVPAGAATRARAGAGARATGLPRQGGVVGGRDGGDLELLERNRQLVEALDALGCPVHSLPGIAGPRLVRLRVVPDIEKRTTVKKIEARAKDLQVALGLDTPPLIHAGPGHVSIDVPRQVLVPCTLSDLLAAPAPGGEDRSPVSFPLGMGIDGDVHWVDLASPSSPSVLVGGMAGSGKSELLKSLVVALGLRAGPDSLRVSLVDPKRVTFMALEGMPHLSRPPIWDGDAALPVLEEMAEEMDRRYEVFAGAGVVDIEAYNRSCGSPVPHHVIVVDEYADLLSNRDTRKRLDAVVQRIGQKGRAAGYHLVLATQRPDAKTVSSLIKANLQLRIALKVASGTNSQVILDEKGAESLQGHGDMLATGPFATVRLQGPLTTRTELERLLQPV